ncbi:conserved phage C-terminal domain-containing protein [Neobacillus sp. NPDC097160]|uniref:conserved phage C-terminal domain-containing protein n=1 Tax=Neobacillus sp. NPDC097160 TaxID=3364298 RepID=UPI0038144265
MSNYPFSYYFKVLKLEITSSTSYLTSISINSLNKPPEPSPWPIKADYKPTTHKTRDLIQARIREGFTLEDFKKVIDIKTSEWLFHPQMSKYLRPTTLFGNKFESYLNQKPFKKTLDEEDFDLDDEAWDIRIVKENSGIL